MSAWLSHGLRGLNLFVDPKKPSPSIAKMGPVILWEDSTWQGQDIHVSYLPGDRARTQQLSTTPSLLIPSLSHLKPLLAPPFTPEIPQLVL